MKKVGIIIALFLTCPLVYSQWVLTVNYTNNCTDMWERLRAELEAERIVNENNNRTFSTKNECDMVRRSIQSPYSCLILDCHCMGHDVGEGGDAATTIDPNTNSYFAGPQQGIAFSPANDADQIKQWMKDYYKQNGLAFNEDFFDYWYANNIYFRKEMDALYAQKHVQIMEMADRESEVNTKEDNLRIKKNERKPNYVDKVKLYQKQLSDATMTKYGRTITGEHGIWNDVVTAAKDGKDDVLDALDVCISVEAEVRFGSIGSLATTTLSTVSFGKSFSDELKELIKDVQWATMSSRDIFEMNKKINEVYAKHIGIMLSRLPGGTVLRYLWNREVKNKTKE